MSNGLMKKVLSALRKATLLLMGAVVGLNVVTMCAGVISRFVANISLGWTDELGSVSLVWITFLGAAMATIDGRHMKMDGLVEKFGQKTRKALSLISYVLILFFTFLMTTYGLSMVRISFATKLASLPISLGEAMIIVPISGAIMFIATANRIAVQLIETFKKGMQRSELP